MNKKTLIGLAGLARSGKDTVSKIIEGQIFHDAEVVRFKSYAFADPLKKAASEIFGLPLERFYDIKGGIDREAPDDFWGISPRRMLQKLGTECCRDLIDRDIWVKRAQKSWDDFQNGVFVISDIRFENEADFVRRNGGSVIHIIRPDIGSMVPSHASERGVKVLDGDLTIDNSGSIDDLKLPVHLSLNKILHNET